MKKLIYIFIVLILVSCNNNEANKILGDEVLDLEMVLDKDSLFDDYDIVEEESFEHQVISTEKLQEFYDLLVLKQKHPEFSKTIIHQLKDYTNDSIRVLSTADILIKNLRLKEDVIQVSDSVQKMKLIYDTVSNNSVQKDSVWATITTNAIIFEGKKIESKKIKFSRL